jgi:hypothetical protein
MTITRTLIRLGCSTALVAGVATLAPAAALAGDSTYHPGSLCRAFAAPADDHLLTPWSTNGTAAKNQGREDAYVMCAQIRDDVGADIGYAQILVSDNVSCNLWRRDALDLDQTAYGEPLSTDLPGGFKRLSYFNGSASAASAGGDMWGFYCNVPPGGIILSYEFNEG